MQTIESITDIADRYDAFIIDLWGVMHDGTTLYPGAKEALAYLSDQKKQTLFLSNAPRQVHAAQATLERLGIPNEHYDHMLTSGQAAYDYLFKNNEWGTNYYYLGPGKDEEVICGLADYTRATDIQQADFILNAGFEYDFQMEDEIMPKLQEWVTTYNKPLICINPDLEVVKQDGTRMLCAGWVANYYSKQGGTVHYFGKPHAHVYERCFELFENTDKNKILAIGDNLLTDIKGANGMGIDSLLITGGILKSDAGHIPTEQELRDTCAQAQAKPSYICELFRT